MSRIIIIFFIIWITNKIFRFLFKLYKRVYSQKSSTKSQSHRKHDMDIIDAEFEEMD